MQNIHQLIIYFLTEIMLVAATGPTFKKEWVLTTQQNGVLCNSLKVMMV